MFQSIVVVIRAISDYSGKVVMWIQIPITLVIFAEVILRYFLNSPTSWGYEFTGYLFGAMSFLGGAYCLRHDQHIRMDIIRGRLSPRRKAILDVIFSSFSYLFLSILVWRGALYAWETTMNLQTSGTVWNPPYWPFTWFLPLGALLFGLQELTNLIANVRVIIRGRI